MRTLLAGGRWLPAGSLLLAASFLGLTAAWLGGETGEEVQMPFVAPSAGAELQGFSFVVYGDVQGNYRNSHDDLARHILQDRPALVFNTGDISPDEGKDYHEEFYPGVRKLAEAIPFFPAAGNHDVNWGSPFSRLGFSRFFDRALHYLGTLALNPHLQVPDSQRLWYSLDYGNSRFIVLDSNFFIDEGKYRETHALDSYQHHAEEQLLWLREVLHSRREHPEIRHTFVFFHHSPFVSSQADPVPLLGIGGHPGHREMLVNHRLPPRWQGEVSYLLDLFRYYRVTAVFTGHEHYYERWAEILRENGKPIHQLNWFVTGNGGVKPRGRPRYKPESIERFLEKDYYQDYLQRIRQIHTGWTAELQHHFPTLEQPSGRFPGYVLVEVGSEAIWFTTKDREGRVRDRGWLSLQRPVLPPRVITGQ